MHDIWFFVKLLFLWIIAKFARAEKKHDWAETAGRGWAAHHGPLGRTVMGWGAEGRGWASRSWHLVGSNKEVEGARSTR